MKRIILKHGEERRILGGHPWVYDNEIERIVSSSGSTAVAGGVESLEPGELADVESEGKTYLGRAFVNPASKIVARLYSPSKEGMDKGFFKRRIREAISRRATYDLRRESARLVFAEADQLPGLIVDRFVGWPAQAELASLADFPRNFDEAEARFGPPLSWLVIQILTVGMETRRNLILAALEETLGARTSGGFGLPAAIIERSNARARELEGLPVAEGLIKRFGATETPHNAPDSVVIFENGLPFFSHLESGQKTGHYLDQKENHLHAARLIAGLGNAERPLEERQLTVLDACAYTGGFAIHVAHMAQTAQILAVDSSREALETLKQNALLNGVEARISVEEADIFEFLRTQERARTRFDAIILDPPAFAKSHTQLKEALRGYKEINLRALKLLNKGGILVSCSCSQATDESDFKRMIRDAAIDAGRRLLQLDFRLQSPDHPILVGYDESCYLKCGFYQVIA
ncbi:MAG: class I SAM-dependent rRNA methyltransferase [Treponema sp.]|nr:class I SAM-dependent rRNA methyltransferase [Treponema sp.]